MFKVLKRETREPLSLFPFLTGELCLAGRMCSYLFSAASVHLAVCTRDHCAGPLWKNSESVWATDEAAAGQDRSRLALLTVGEPTDTASSVK